MSAITTPDPWAVAEADAVTELGRFVQLTREPAARDKAGVLPMFSLFVDAVWHRMLNGKPTAYETFRREHAGTAIEHTPWPGRGSVGWVTAYEKAYGQLPKAWFADASGRVDPKAWASYALTGTVVTDWECRPVRPDDDEPDEFDSPVLPQFLPALSQLPSDEQERWLP